jgi:hypothetical protein
MKQIKMKKPEPVLTLADGREGVRRHRTDYWYDRRFKEPSLYMRPGFPKTQEGSIEGVAKLVMKGWITKGACYDRVTGEYLWTVERGQKVPGTPLYAVVIWKGEA